MNNKKRADEYYSKNKDKIKDTDRPAYHFTADIGWLNDPNGFSLYKDEYHLFYQYNPYDIKWGPMHWGHAKTKDFINWERLSVALAPDDEMPGQCFSGTAITEGDKHILLYTVHNSDKEEQALAIGDGLEYKSISDKPVIGVELLPEGFSGADFRDPKIWVEDGGYSCILSAKNSKGLGSVLKFSSKDLKNWEYRGVLYENTGEYGKMWECPDFFKLGDKYILVVSVMEMQAKNREYFNGHQVIYFVGAYDKEKSEFIPEGKGITLDFGFDYYAPQTLDDKEEILSLAWLHDWANNLSPGDAKWCGQMTYPRRLELKDNRIYQLPSKKIEKSYRNEYKTNFVLEADKEYSDENLNSRLARFDIDISNKDAKKLRIYLAADNRHTSFIDLDTDNKTLKFSRRFSGLSKDAIDERKIDTDFTDGKLSLSILLDRFSVEIFINGGKQVISSRIYTPAQADELRFIADGKVEISVCKNEIA